MYNLSLQIIFCLAASLISASFYTMYSNKNEPKFKMALMLFISHMIILLPAYEEYKMLLDVIQIVVELLIIVFVIDNTLMNKLIMYVELNIAFGIAAIFGNYIKDDKIAYLLTTLVIGAIMCYIFICWHNRNKDKKIKSFDGKIIAIILSISLLCYLYITGIVIENLNKINAFIVYLCFVYCIVAIYELLVICEKIRMNEMITRQQKVVSAINNNIKNIVDKLNEAAQTENSNIECVRNKIEELYKETANTKVYRLLFDKKCIKAKENGCKIIITGNIDEVFCDIKAFDYVTIIGNLLDNAIEAASKCATNNVIKVDISKEKIIIENAYSGELLIVDDKIQTKKTEEGHGFGLNNAKKALFNIGKELNVIAEKGIFNVCIKSILLMFFIAGFSFVDSMSAYADEIIDLTDIGDEVFYEHCISNYDYNQDGMFTQSDALAISSVYVPDGVVNIEGLSFFENMNELSFTDCKSISDYSILYELDNIVYLGLRNTNIDNLDFLINMPNIEWLDIAYCVNIVDYSYIDYCDKLRCLDASGSGLTDISFLNGKNIDELTLTNCEISDYSQLQSISPIRLHISNVKDISFLKNYEKIELFSILNSYDIEDYSIIGECATLKELYITSCNMSDASFLSDLTKLSTFSFIDLKNLTVIPDLKHLSDLYMICIANSSLNLYDVMMKLNDGVTVMHDTGSFIVGETPIPDVDDNINDNETDRTLESILDLSINVIGKFDENTYLEAVELKNLDNYKDMLNNITNNVENIYKYHVYDISLFKDVSENGVTVKIKVQPDESVKVSITVTDYIDGMGYYVFRQEDDGSLTELRCSRVGQVISFQSDHFSIFTLVITNMLGESENDDIDTESEDNAGFIEDNNTESKESFEEIFEEMTSDVIINETEKEEKLEEQKDIPKSGDDTEPMVSDEKDEKQNVKKVKVLIIVGSVLMVLFAIVGFEIYRNNCRRSF